MSQRNRQEKEQTAAQSAWAAKRTLICLRRVASAYGLNMLEIPLHGIDNYIMEVW